MDTVKPEKEAKVGESAVAEPIEAEVTMLISKMDSHMHNTRLQTSIPLKLRILTAYGRIQARIALHCNSNNNHSTIVLILHLVQPVELVELAPHVHSPSQIALPFILDSRPPPLPQPRRYRLFRPLVLFLSTRACRP